jgi:hypothetical protein
VTVCTRISWVREECCALAERWCGAASPRCADGQHRGQAAFRCCNAVVPPHAQSSSTASQQHYTERGCHCHAQRDGGHRSPAAAGERGERARASARGGRWRDIADNRRDPGDGWMIALTPRDPPAPDMARFELLRIGCMNRQKCAAFAQHGLSVYWGTLQ